MTLLVGLLLLLSPETERMLLGDSPFFRHEGMERARREGDEALLLEAARSPYWDARRCAAEGLGAKTPLELLDDPVPVVREAAIRALDLAAPETKVVALLRDADDAVRAEAAWAMRAASSRLPLRKLVQDRSPTVRVAALAAAGDWSHLRSLAARDEIGIAVPALGAIGRAGGPAEAAFLLGRLRRTLRDEARETEPIYLRARPTSDVALARALGEMARRGVASGSRTVAEELSLLVAKSDLKSPGALLLAEVAAGARDPDAAARILAAQLEARGKSTLPNVYLDPGVQAVLHAFAREPWPELAPLLVPLLEAKSAAVRTAVAEALSGDAARAALADEAPDVRAVACGRVLDAEALLPLARDRDPGVREACARALGRLGDERGVPGLAVLVHDLEPPVRRAAVGALLRTPAPGRTGMLLLTALTDEEPAVRQTAAAALEFLDEEEAVLPRAIAALLAEEREVRVHALELIHALTEARFGYDPDAPAEGHAEWAAWWERKETKKKKDRGFRYHVEDLRRKGIDLVLVLDATGSMSPVIQTTKRRIEAVVAGLREVVPDLRARVVAYRDEGDVFVTMGSPLTHDPRILEDFLACVPAWGGGDEPEAVLAGIREAIKGTPWREGTHRVIVLFGDAPPHDRDMTLVEATCREFKGVIHAADVGRYGRGGAGAALPAFRSIAEWGSGTAVTLTDERDLLRNVLVLTLGPRYRTQVETLFGL